MRTKVLAVALIGVFVTMSMFALPSAGAVKASTQVKWMELIYLDADNSLDVNAGPHHMPVVQSDLDELMSVGSTKDVMVYALVDRLNATDHLFKVNKGSLTEMTSFPLDGKEMNMGDPATLRSFVQFTTNDAHNPLHTLLIFWDHGTPQYVAWDDNAGPNGGSDMLTHQEAIQALQGYHIDVMGADECLVGQTEVAYEYAVKAKVDYAVFSETFTGWEGFPYDTTLRDIVANPAMTPRNVAMMIVNETQMYVNQNPNGESEVNSHGAIDLSKMPALANSITNLTTIMTPQMKDYAGLVSKARGAAQFSYGANPLNLVDLKTFVQAIGAMTGNQQIKNACAAVVYNFNQTVIDLQVTNTVDHQLYGLGIALPNHSWEMPSYYLNFAFPYLGWYSFLQAYWAAAGSV